VQAWFAALSRRRAARLIFVVVLFAAVGAIVGRLGSPVSPPSPAVRATAASIPSSTDTAAATLSLAVLPFAMGAADADAHFADGLAEDLIRILGRVDGLTVLSRGSSFAFKTRGLSAAEIGRELGVGYLLEGTARRDGERLRVAVRLLRVADEQTLWTQQYARPVGDVFAVQQAIAQGVTDALADTLGVRQVQVAAPTANLAAYELYLRGRQAFARRGDALLAARDALQEAVGRDPEFAAAWAALAATWYVLPTYFGDTPADQALQRAQYAAQRALKLDPAQADALAVKSRLLSLRGKRVRAAELLDQALRIDPNNANGWLWRGLSAREAGHLAAARAALQRASMLDPLSGIQRGWLAATLASLGEHDAAVAMLAEAEARGWRDPARQIGLHLALGRETDAQLAARLNHWVTEARLLDERQRAVYRQIASALEQPDLRIAARAAVADAVRAAPQRDWSEPLLLLRDHAAALDEARRSRDAAFATWPLLVWLPAHRAMRELPDFLLLAEQRGMAAYWQQYGPPDGCRRVEDPAPRLACER